MSHVDPPYPDTGPLAVLARVAMMGTILAIATAALIPAPHVIYSYNLEHFAAFYITAVAAAAALPRTPLWRLALGMLIVACLAETARLVYAPPAVVVHRWSADIGGIMAAYVPILAERFRRRFPPRPARKPPPIPGPAVE